MLTYSIPQIIFFLLVVFVAVSFLLLVAKTLQAE